MSLTPVYILGNLTAPVCTERKLRRNSRGLDTGTLEYVSNNELTFRPGTAPPSDANLRIDDVDTTQDVAGIWEHVLSVSGIAGPKGERHFAGSPDPHRAAGAEFDSVKIHLITNNPNRYRVGQTVGGFGIAMVCMSVNPKPLDDHSGWYDLSAELKGLYQAKNGTRTITATGKTISGDNVTWPIQSGWNTPRPGEVDISSVTVVDEFISLSPPPTADTPGSLIPDDTPSIRVFNLSLTDAREYWPNGWKFIPSGQQMVKGVSIWKNTFTHIWTPQYLPK